MVAVAVGLDVKLDSVFSETAREIGASSMSDTYVIGSINVGKRRVWKFRLVRLDGDGQPTLLVVDSDRLFELSCEPLYVSVLESKPSQRGIYSKVIALRNSGEYLFFDLLCDRTDRAGIGTRLAPTNRNRSTRYASRSTHEIRCGSTFGQRNSKR